MVKGAACIRQLLQVRYSSPELRVINEKRNLDMWREPGNTVSQKGEESVSSQN
jgi:hypothetical protein